MKKTNKPEQRTADHSGRTLSILALIGIILIAGVLAVGLTAYAFLAPQSGVPPEEGTPETALTWHREGGLAGFCEDVVVYATGHVYVYSCQGELPMEIGRKRLDAGQLTMLASWLDTLEPFEYEESDPATADGMKVRLTFSGTGEQTVQAVDRQVMMHLAQALYNEVMLLADDAPSVCPTPGASQQLLLDREAGYCLLYPAEYSLEQPEPGVAEIVAGSVLNHAQPRVSIAVEEAGGRSLAEVLAQLKTDYVPDGWEVTGQYIVVDGVEAVVLDNLPGQDLNRRVAFIREGRLYALFLAPIGDEGSKIRLQAETLYRQVLDSFRFLNKGAPIPPPVTNADGPEPIQFAPGSSSATVRGPVTALEPKRYVLQGLGGQTLSVVLETASLQTYITVLTPKGENMAGADGPIHRWSGRLPVDGDYVIEVINPEGNSADFELTTTLSPAPQGDSGADTEPVEVLIQLDWAGGFGPPEAAVPFGRVPAFTLLADGRVLYVDHGDPLEPNQEQLLIAQLRPDQVQALVQEVLDLGFERLESHLDQCQESDDGSSLCVADAGYSILRVRLPNGQLREIRNWHEFANDAEALLAIRGLLSDYRHPEAVPYLPDNASLFIQPILSAEGLTVANWPLNPGWLTPLAPGVEQWAGVLAAEERDVLLRVTSRNMGVYYFRDEGRLYQVILVPWLPGTDYADEVLTYRRP
jgi:hypothetical protein